MTRTIIFTISVSDRGYSIKNSEYSAYNYINIPGIKIYWAMEELADTFNNKLGLGILFEIE